MRTLGFLKKLTVGVVLVIAVLVGGAGPAAADGSSWYGETILK